MHLAAVRCPDLVSVSSLSITDGISAAQPRASSAMAAAELRQARCSCGTSRQVIGLGLQNAQAQRTLRVLQFRFDLFALAFAADKDGTIVSSVAESQMLGASPRRTVPWPPPHRSALPCRSMPHD